MKCINFDRAFERYMAGWMKENSEKYKDDMDVIEDMMPDVYLEFLQKPADFLDGVAPQNYFEQFDDAICLSAGFAIILHRAYPFRICCLNASRAWANPLRRACLLYSIEQICRKKRK